MKLRFSPRAMQDLIDIADYIRQRNPAAGVLLPFSPTVAPARADSGHVEA